MSDLISRQVAIERATKDHDFYRGATVPTDKARRDELLNVMCWLNELPSAERQWIPVSERMPENGQYVLFCDIDEDIMLGYHVKGRPDTHFSQDGSWDDMKNVLAWMPLPKPYEGGKQ